MMTEESNEYIANEGAPSSLEHLERPKASEEYEKMAETEFDESIRQADALRVVPSTEAEAGVCASSTDKTEENAEGVEDGYAKGIRLVLTNFALTLVATLTLLDISILATAIPTITDEFHSTADIGWYISTYQVALSALQPTTGKLFTYLPNKWTYITFLVVFELGSLICALANSSSVFIGGRIVAGLGASGLSNGAMTIIAALVPLERRPALTGILMGFSQLGLVGGPLIGGSLTEYASWRWCFWINLPIGALAILVIILVHIPEQHPKAPIRVFLRSPHLVRTFDLGGGLILIPGLVMLLLALQFGGTTHPWTSATVIGLFFGFGATTALFIAWEWRIAGADAMLPIKLFRNRVVALACLNSVCVVGCTFVTAYFLPIYFQSIQGASPFSSGVYVLPSILSQLCMSVVSGVGVSKLGYYLPWAVFASIAMMVGSGLITTWSTTTGIGKWIGYQVILGIGRGAGVQQGMIALQTVLPDSQIAVSMAVIMFLHGLIGSVLVSLANTIFVNSLLSEIVTKAPSANAEAVLKAGATAFRKLVSPEQLPHVLEAYAFSIGRVFYLALGLSTVTFVTSWGLGWRDVREKKKQRAGTNASEEWMEKGHVED